MATFLVHGEYIAHVVSFIYRTIVYNNTVPIPQGIKDDFVTEYTNHFPEDNGVLNEYKLFFLLQHMNRITYANRHPDEDLAPPDQPYIRNCTFDSDPCRLVKYTEYVTQYIGFPNSATTSLLLALEKGLLRHIVQQLPDFRKVEIF